jgi:hypothetical protein
MEVSLDMERDATPPDPTRLPKPKTKNDFSYLNDALPMAAIMQDHFRKGGEEKEGEDGSPPERRGKNSSLKTWGSYLTPSPTLLTR